MNNAGASIISALGGGSGVNFIQLAEDLSDATYSFQRFNLQSRNETLTARISSASLLRNSLTQLAAAIGDRVRGGDLAPRATVGSPSVVDVTTTSGVVPSGSYSLEVTRLAQGQTLVMPAYGSKDDLVGGGTLAFRFGEVDGASFTEGTGAGALEIAVEATDTLGDLAGRINSQSGGKLKAYVAEGSNGAQLVIKGGEGAQSGFVLEPVSAAVTPADVPGDLAYLAWDPASDAGELRQFALDAEFTLDTIAMSSATNKVAGLPEGLTFDLKSTNTGAPATIAFSNDTGAISGVMQDFVAALNDLATALNEEAAAFGGTLGNDGGARALKRDLAELAGKTVMPTADEGEPSTLADLGLRITREGRFELDTERLAATLAASPDGAAAMFTTGPFGLYATMDRLARDNTLRTNPGTLGGSMLRFEALVERNDAKLEKIAESQESLRLRLTRDLVAAERRVSASQTTLTFLQQQIRAWNGSDS